MSTGNGPRSLRRCHPSFTHRRQCRCLFTTRNRHDRCVGSLGSVFHGVSTGKGSCGRGYWMFGPKFRVFGVDVCTTGRDKSARRRTNQLKPNYFCLVFLSLLLSHSDIRYSCSWILVKKGPGVTSQQPPHLLVWCNLFWVLFVVITIKEESVGPFQLRYQIMCKWDLHEFRYLLGFRFYYTRREVRNPTRPVCILCPVSPHSSVSFFPLSSNRTRTTRETFSPFTSFFRPTVA